VTDPKERLQAAFRIHLEQQKKQAKELLKAGRSGDPNALARLTRSSSHRTQPVELKLADAQLRIARELGLSSWSELKSHVASMDRARESSSALDGDAKTLHLRCGSDIKSTLLQAGFAGAFREHSYPYAHGPVSCASDHLELEARFLEEFAGVPFGDALEHRRREEQALHDSADHFDRIVLWMEHDPFDQLVMTRCLAHYRTRPTRPMLELISVNRFPGSIRFIGLGQLPPEALRLLWQQRTPVTEDQLQLASDIWSALCLEDPRTLASITRAGTPALPHLAPALHRLLQELPSVRSGLGLTEQLILQRLLDGETSLRQLFASLVYESDPLPHATDLMLLQMVRRMQSVSQPLLMCSSAPRIWDAKLTMTEIGKRVLEGSLDFLSLQPAARWVGALKIGGPRVWRWNERDRDVVYS
jgi:hypothetical protein